MRAFELASGQPWAILPEMLTTILSIAARETDPEAVAAKLGRPLENTYHAEVRDGVAILPVSGPVMRYANLFSKVSGATSIDVLATDFNQALENPDVKAIILNIDSPGGTVAGVNELAEMIYAARGKKPIVSYVSGMGASAAYWLASAADEIVLDATASVGSIGVVSIQSDDTERKAKAGVKEIQIVSSLSPRKRPDLSTEEGRADVQAMVDSIAKVFFQTVARNRSVTTDAVLSDFGQGGLMVGSDAVDAGMADRIGSLEQVIAGLSGAFKRGKIMTEQLKSEAQDMTMDSFIQRYPAMAETLKMEGANQERERIKSVEDQLISGHESLIQSLKFDGKTTGAEAAIKVLSAEKENRNKMLSNLKADAPAAVPMPSIHQADKSDQSMPEEEIPEDEKYEAQWRKDAKLRSEFSSKESFMAYMKAQSNGQVRLLRRAAE
jgi:signal peptide peptidase SppA